MDTNEFTPVSYLFMNL